ncbi:lysylphosphatidylglycerol synthase transmembrane domain-containing protein [Ruegeria jejuensis]|uniref:lysylphosphatidylglycerol synthase transmembrane domain-containing protein n=1 Tax=Ruegeria jejuensis TaxID=3233338 RepID=UPI00355C757F
MKLKINSPIVRILGSIVLLGLLAYQIDMAAFYRSLREISPEWIFFTILLGVALMLFNAFRWSFLVDRQLGIPFKVFVQLTFFSSYAGLFLPGTIGAEAIRVGGLARESSLAVATASVIVDRLMSLMSQFILALVALAFVADSTNSDLRLWASGGVLVMLLGAGMIMNRRMRAAILKLIYWPRLQIVRDQVEKFFNALDTYRNGKVIRIALVLAFLLQIFRGIFLWACASAIGANISVVMFLVALPMVSLIEIVPISMAGVGPREAAFSFVLAQFGIPPEQSVTASLIAFITGTVIASAIGFFAISLMGYKIHKSK